MVLISKIFFHALLNTLKLRKSDYVKAISWRPKDISTKKIEPFDFVVALKAKY